VRRIPASVRSSCALPIATLLVLLRVGMAAHAAGDATRGAEAYEARCGGCHSVESDRVGPRHAGIVGRRAGSVAGFAYSPALKASGFTWDPARLERWLTDPESLVPGQRMGYRVDDAAVRADVIAYLATLNPGS